MPLDRARLDALIADLTDKNDVFAARSGENDAAQTAAQAAVASASGALQAKNAANVAFDETVDALVAYVRELRDEE